jgi:hypothetical protein
VENLDLSPLKNFHLGVYFDWDIGFVTSNMAGWDASRKLGYAYDQGEGPTTYVGMSVLTDGGVHYFPIWNDEADPNNPTWGLYDGYSDDEKWQSISSGVPYISAGPGDISHVIAAGPFTVDGKSTLDIGFALIAGDDLKHLQANADSAASAWDALLTADVTDGGRQETPDVFQLEQNYPNPFNPYTTIGFHIPAVQHVHLAVFNTAGQLVATLVDEKMNAGAHRIDWDASALSSGVYFYRLTAGEFSSYGKCLLLK